MRLNPFKSKQTLEPPNSSIGRERMHWARILAELEARWSRLGLVRLWWLRRAGLSQHLKKIHESTPSEHLFSAQEQAIRRSEMIQFLESDFLTQLEAGLTESIWQRMLKKIPFIHRKQETRIEKWQQRYQTAGLSRNFENQYDLYIRKKEDILHRDVNKLFDSKERAGRLESEIKSAKRIFRKFQERHLKRHTRFANVIRSLPEDELDDQIMKLAEDFSLIGRSKEWFREYEKLISDVFDQIKNKDYGQNEPVIRLLQNDFLLTMQGRFSIYWRYYELRDICFANDMAELINEISYFEKERSEMLDNGAPFHECDILLKKFIRTLDTALATEARREKSERNRKDRLLDVDHSTRLEEWAAFKETNPAEHTSVISIFNHLRPILVHCPEWRQELSVFRSLVKVKRLSDKHRKNSEAEIRDARLFVQRMTDRIDSEITTDVSFRLLEQELIRDEEYLPDLYLARRKIALERETRNANSAEQINDIKQAFIRVIWNKRAPEEEQEAAVVTPMFARSSGALKQPKLARKTLEDDPANFNK